MPLDTLSLSINKPMGPASVKVNGYWILLKLLLVCLLPWQATTQHPLATKTQLVHGTSGVKTCRKGNLSIESHKGATHGTPSVTTRVH